MFLPWSLSALQWGTVIPVSKGRLPLYKYISIWIVVCCYRTFLPIHAQLVSTRIGWLIVVGGEFQTTTHRGGGNTLQRGQKRDLFMSGCFFCTWLHQHRLSMCTWQCRFARNCAWVENNRHNMQILEYTRKILQFLLPILSNIWNRVVGCNV